MKLKGKYGTSWNTFVGALEGCIQILDFTLDSADILGGTGFGFRLNIHSQLEPEGLGFPWGDELGYGINRLGYACRSMRSLPLLPLHKQYCEKAHLLICKGIEEGKASIVWGIHGSYFGLIIGFDQERKVYFVSGICDSREGAKEIPFGALESSKEPLAVYQPSQKFADFLSKESALSVFHYAVEHGMGKGAMLRGYAIGLEGYDLWSNALLEGNVHPFGACYTAKQFGEARQAIPQYLEKMKTFFQEKSLMEEIIQNYQDVAENLAKVSEAFPSPFENPEIPESSKRKEIADLLITAKMKEEKALKGLEKLIAS